jgi:phage-related minor tail protein
MGEVPGKSEGIFPLQRMGNGDLGVRATGGGSNLLVYQPTYQMDLGGRGGSSGDISQEAFDALGKQLDRELEKKVREVMTRAIQPGGVLNKGVNRRR